LEGEVSQTQWALRITDKSEALRQMAKETLTRGDRARASQMISRIGVWQNDYLSVLQMGLSAKKPCNETPLDTGEYLFNDAFASQFDRIELLRCRIDVKTRSAFAAIARLAALSANPAVRKIIRKTPNSLR
jgi:hypothetical protein